MVKRETSTSQINTRVTTEFKEKLKVVLKDNNKTVKDVLEHYVNTYYSTTPTGLIYRNEELRKEISIIEDEIATLIERKNKLLKEISNNENIINNANFYDIKYYKDNENVMNGIKGLKNYYERKRHSISKIQDIPINVIDDIAIKNNIKTDDLIKIAETDFKNW